MSGSSSRSALTRPTVLGIDLDGILDCELLQEPHSDVGWEHQAGGDVQSP
jgi:hypothetical protein